MSGFGEPADGELVVLAQQGDAGALGTLLARHRGGMLAVALSVMHDPGESEDAVQDASLTALARIGDLRDPDAVGPWLRMIVRNLCRKRLRARQAIPVGHLTPPERAADPQEALERHAQRDWIWHAVGRLSPPLRTVTLLRYFSSVTRYEEIAAVCGVPVGTVRRRLHEARGMLARTLPGTWDGAHGDAAVAVAARRREADELIAAGHQGTFRAALRESWWPDVEIAWGERTAYARHRAPGPGRGRADGGRAPGSGWPRWRRAPTSWCGRPRCSARRRRGRDARRGWAGCWPMRAAGSVA
ncbi:sigma-70 family RNA polymerase sigma factor [Nonomuraea salmonea]|uniref:RNA polymerase sigma factor n=1 Tax=Nonomuraea salmonea TaxID=46181 RepID=UPI0031E66AE3